MKINAQLFVRIKCMLYICSTLIKYNKQLSPLESRLIDKKMKKIINGKKYDTETAEVIGYWSNHLGSNDFNSLSETLYKKKTGEFFLYGEGGANTRYSKSNGNSSWGSSTIIPFAEREAMDWLEEHGDADRYEEVFGEVEE